MARRPEHLQLRGSTWWVRVRIPDELRPIIGKLEIRRSLHTSDATEAKRRVRIERIKIEAEFDDARRALAQSRAGHAGKAKLAELTEEQVWALATRWFVGQEKRNASYPVHEVDEEVIENQAHQLAFVENWESASASVTEEVNKVLVEASVPIDQNSEPPAWRAKLSRVIHAAMIERDKRLLNRLAGGRGIALNPLFNGLSEATNVQPVAISAVTLSDLIKRFDRDPGRVRPSPKTKLKLDAQRRLFKDVVGGSTLLGAIDRDKARKLLDTLKALTP